MQAKKPLPSFENEADEARWYYEHRQELDDYFGTPGPPQVLLAAQLGLEHATRHPGGALPHSTSEPITLELLHEDLEALKAIAAHKGLGYQTLIRSVVHDFVVREQANGPS